MENVTCPEKRVQGTRSIMGWTGKIRVNGTTYKWLGMDETGTPANVTNVQVTPTRTLFVMQAGPMNVTITFLSPVEVRSSLAFTFRCLSQALDGTVSPTTGSSSRFHFLICRWNFSRSTETAIRCSCTQTSRQV